MGQFKVKKSTLVGEVDIGGAKNAVLPILASVILNNGEVKITNVPEISDTYVAIKILESVGVTVIFKNNEIIANSKNITATKIPLELVKEMRSSIIFMGSLLGRCNECVVSYPGGCELGTRPIDLHIDGLKKMGVTIKNEGDEIICNTTKLKGATINLTFPSVGATENLMLAGVLATGTTVISNVAKEPEIVDLANFLNKMGAKITGAGTSTIIIEGVSNLHDCSHKVVGDRIVGSTYLVGAVMTGIGSDVTINNINVQDLQPVCDQLALTGAIIKYYENSINIKPSNIISPIKELKTNPHPGFPTDVQPQLLAMLSIANGNSVIIENLFESRNKHAFELNKLGANITVRNGNIFNIEGVRSLEGTIVDSHDLRGGAALILAGLYANGTTTVTNSNYVERGYENIVRDLKLLGANIEFFN